MNEVTSTRGIAFKSGKNRAETARMLNISRRIVNTWVATTSAKNISA